MENEIKVVRNISESKAFKNCIEILENFELEQKPFKFTENYIKWLLNKFQMPFVFVTPFEDLAPDEKPEDAAAFAIDAENLISVPIKELNYSNLYKRLFYIAHEVKHLSDREFYTNNLILGRDHNLYSTAYNDKLLKLAKIDEITNSNNLLKSSLYYLNSHEIGARECEYFYSNLFLRLAKNVVNNPKLKQILNTQIEKCVKKSNSIEAHLDNLRSYKTLSSYKQELAKIEERTNRVLKKYLKLIKQNEINRSSLEDTTNELTSLLALFPNEKVGKKLLKIFLSQKHSSTLPLLQIIASMPYDIFKEREVNKYLIYTPNLYTHLISAIEPSTLTERFLFLHGTQRLDLNLTGLYCDYDFSPHLAKIRNTQNKFSSFNIVGLCNMPNSIKKQYALAKFIYTKNFKLTTKVLNEYNDLFNGEFYTLNIDENLNNKIL